ncbi:UbiA family prenyltransferase [Micromonospora sp. WMMD812]|uniref:UbiA family prenyltransferase n=1 Tax=Micromonospora sp. WMMD812 TaxID=3015152 RepID=UPI00248C1AD3|nr:UbiA family prenyltransferase [Micromonospora sp. WMMD812]WBB68258.1 UbiA family prenyltransferase [Micromonospora sp. WMMD812]
MDHPRGSGTATIPGTRSRTAASRPQVAWAVVRLARPWFWPLGWAGAYLGLVLATRSWVPPADTLPAAITALVVLGPLVWGAVLTVNDLHDLPSDRHNPRKATAPLVTGVLTGADLRRWHRRCVVAAMAAAATIGPAFVAGTAAVLALGWLYSAPPVRLKGRPGVDVTVNALVVGVLAPMAGWSLHRPVGEYPAVMILLGLLLAAALYVPTTVLDVDADLVAGDATAAVRWKPRACYRLGLALWSSASALWLASCHLDLIVRRDSWTLQTVAVPILVAVYAAATRKPSIPRMAAVSLAFAVPAADFLAAVAG